MNSKEILPVAVVSTLLLVNCILIFFGGDITLINIIALAGPLLLIWMVYSVLKHGQYKGSQLKENEEWGYAGKNRNDLGMF